ncbi:MAG: hypothetical protein KBC06_02185 [Candidatus Pacebacteria bacterium]|nr:hypothetical protein [Candidatus Paceibacterota bacterium]
MFTSNDANAATLSIAPSSSTVTNGNIVTVKVVVNTVGKYINNGEATIAFPTDLLDVVSITKSSSIFTLWVEEPTFSNNTGKIVFNGGVANPGFNGTNGTIASITFKTKKPGTASLIFTDGAVRENDGLGTDILTAKNSSSIVISSPAVVEPKVVPVVKNPEPEKNEDTIPPEPFTPTSRVYDNQNIVKLNAKDADSGIDYYTIQVDSNPIITIKKGELVNSEYTLPYLQPGSHDLIIVAYDQAGNKREALLTIIAPFISTPVLSLSSNEITKGDKVVISGKTDYPNKQVVVTLESEGKEIKKYTQSITADGSFSVTTDGIQTLGVINIWAENILSDKVKSQPSEKVYLSVNETKFVKMTTVIVGLMVILIILLVLLILLYLGWHKFFGLRKKIRHELEETVTEVHKATLLLKEELEDQLKMLEKIKMDRVLSKKEESIFRDLETNIDEVEKFIEKKLKKLM